MLIRMVYNLFFFQKDVPMLKDKTSILYAALLINSSFVYAAEKQEVSSCDLFPSEDICERPKPKNSGIATGDDVYPSRGTALACSFQGSQEIRDAHRLARAKEKELSKHSAKPAKQNCKQDCYGRWYFDDPKEAKEVSAPAE